MNAPAAPPVNRLDSWLAKERDEAAARLAKFRTNLSENGDGFAHFVLESADGAFVDAARYRVTSDLIKRRERGAKLVQLRGEAFQETVRRARCIKRSTSPSANLMSNCFQEAWAEFYEQLTTRFVEEDAVPVAPPEVAG